MTIDFQALRLSEGDIVVLKGPVDELPSQDDLRILEQFVFDATGKRVTAISLGTDLSLDVLDAQSLQAAGWERAPTTSMVTTFSR